MKRIPFFALIALSSLVFLSCEKDEPTYPFTVIAVNEDGQRVQNAHIVAEVPLPNVYIKYEGITSADGSAHFVHKGDGKLVLQVRITKGAPPQTPVVAGCGYVQLEPDEEVSVTVAIGNYDPADPGC